MIRFLVIFHLRRLLQKQDIGNKGKASGSPKSPMTDTDSRIKPAKKALVIARWENAGRLHTPRSPCCSCPVGRDYYGAAGGSMIFVKKVSPPLYMYLSPLGTPRSRAGKGPGLSFKLRTPTR